MYMVNVYTLQPMIGSFGSFRIVYLSLHHKTSRHAHIVDHSEYVYVALVLVVLQESVDAHKSARPAHARTAMNNCRPAGRKAIHLVSHLSHEPHQRIKRVRYTVVWPNDEMKLNEIIGRCLKECLNLFYFFPFLALDQHEFPLNPFW